MSGDNTILVVGIDFGTSGSGYAFSFRHEFTSNPLNISTYTWTGCAYKTPSSILFKPDRTFDTFGDEAEDHFKELCENGRHHDWYFLHGFKMQLYKAVHDGKDIREDLLVKDIKGNLISGKLVFSEAIGYLKKHMINELESRNTGVPEEYIHWVITIPAIWDAACKQFMIESVKMAGIDPDRFSLVFEPEAASIYAKHLPLEKMTGENNTFVLKAFDPGKKFIVVDGGGGTVDISAQQVGENGELKVIHRACGGPFGGDYINQEYRRMLTRICGGDVLRELKENHIGDYTEMMKNFETKKKMFDPDSPNIVVRFPASLSDILSETTGYDFSGIVKEGSLMEKLKTKRDKLFIDKVVFLSFFEQSIKCIIDEISNVLEDPLCSDIKTIMMVGGFSESEVIRSGVRKAFEGKDLIIPQDGGLAVLKGAVLYGHNPRTVSSRICEFTYGVATVAPFQHGVHDERKLILEGGEELCDDIFHKCLTINDPIDPQHKMEISLSFNYEGEDKQDKRKEDGQIEIYVSRETSPMYVTENGVALHAIINIPPPRGLWAPISHGQLELEIDGTEMRGTYIDKTTGARTSAKFQFLPFQDVDDRRRIFDPALVPCPDTFR